MTQAHPEVYKPEDRFQIGVTRMHDQINARANTVLWVLFAASGLLFVIASSNVANLVLARTVRREPELAVRSALGASTAVLRRSLLAESLVLCGSGVIAALARSPCPWSRCWGSYAARFSVAPPISRSTRAWFGSASRSRSLPPSSSPTFRACRRRSARLGLTGRGARVTGSSRRLRIFAVTQIAASFLLLAGAGVLMKTLYVLEQTRPPFDSSQRSGHQSARTELRQDAAAGAACSSRNMGRVSALPGVEHVADGFSVPWRGEQGLRHQPAFAAQGAHARRQRGFPRELPLRVPRILLHLRVPILMAATSMAATRRLRARRHHQPEPRQSALSRSKPINRTLRGPTASSSSSASATSRGASWPSSPTSTTRTSSPSRP